MRAGVPIITSAEWDALPASKRDWVMKDSLDLSHWKLTPNVFILLHLFLLLLILLAFSICLAKDSDRRTGVRRFQSLV